MGVVWRCAWFDIEGGLTGGPFLGMDDGQRLWGVYPQPRLALSDALRCVQGIGGRYDPVTMTMYTPKADAGPGGPENAWPVERSPLGPVWQLGRGMWYWQEVEQPKERLPAGSRGGKRK